MYWYCADIEIANKIQFMKCSGVQNGHNIKVRSPKYSKLAAAAAEVQEPGSRTTETLFREQFRFCGVNIRILSEFYQNSIRVVLFCHRSPGCRVVLPTATA